MLEGLWTVENLIALITLAVLVGIFLMAEGMHKHIDRGYIYFAMAFSLFVEFLNLRMKKVKREVEV